MAQTGNNGVNDSDLVAYLDDELSPSEKETVAGALKQNAELRDRLARFERGGRPFAPAFDALLEAAPDDKLQAMFATLVTDHNVSGAGSADIRPATRRMAWQMAAAAAVLVVAFASGMATNTLLAPDQGKHQLAARGWREAVAQYVSLFSRATLDGMPTDRAAQEEGLKRASAALGLNLAAEKLTAPTLTFRGTQLLQLDGKPIVQIAYLGDNQVPLAFCIVRSTQAAQPVATERRHGLNIVHWVAGGYGFMLIGDAPDADLRRLAEPFRARFG
jgi:anti-sigma factor RsiW